MRQKAYKLSFILSFLFSTDIACAQGRIGEKVPGFSTVTLAGQRVALKEYWEKQRKKAVILSFFATWCQPCKADLQYLQKVQTQHGTQGPQVLSMPTQDSPKEAEQS